MQHTPPTSTHPSLNHMSGICNSIIKLIALRNLSANCLFRGVTVCSGLAVCSAKQNYLNYSHFLESLQLFVITYGHQCHTLLLPASTIPHTISRVNKSSTGQKLCVFLHTISWKNRENQSLLYFHFDVTDEKKHTCYLHVYRLFCRGLIRSQTPKSIHTQY